MHTSMRFRGHFRVKIISVKSSLLLNNFVGLTLIATDEVNDRNSISHCVLIML